MRQHSAAVLLEATKDIATKNPQFKEMLSDKFMELMDSKLGIAKKAGA